MVVAGVVRRGEWILISQRGPRGAHAGRWEFPGGKVEPGERDEHALAREIREELGVTVEVGPRIWTEPAGPIELRFHECRWPAAARPRALGVAQFRWVRAGDLDRYDFPPADAAFVASLAAGRPRSRQPGEPR